MTHDHLTLRLATDADEREIHRLAARDTSPAPAAPALLATENGRLVAALSLADGATVADPFVPSAGALELLRLRAAHLGGGIRPSGGAGILRRLLRRPPRSPRLTGAAARRDHRPPADLAITHQALTRPR